MTFTDIDLRTLVVLGVIFIILAAWIVIEGER